MIDETFLFIHLTCILFILSCIPGALAFAELGMVVPKSGGQYAFFQEAFKDMHPFYGPIIGFIYVLINVFFVYPATLAIACLTFTEYVYESMESLLTEQLNAESEATVKFLLNFIALGQYLAC